MTDRKAIYDLHSSKVYIDGYDGMEFYFSQLFKPDNVLVNDINSHVCASVQVNYHTLMLNDVRVAAGFVFAPIGTRDNPEYLQQLMNEVLDEQTYKTLITIMQTDDGENYQKLGFAPLYKKRSYDITAANLKNVSSQGVMREFTMKEVAETYRIFTSFFNGYYLRDEEYWQTLLEHLKFRRCSIVVYRNEEGEVEGYMIYHLTQQKLVADEIIYLTGEALVRLVCYGLQAKDVVSLNVSQDENLGRVFSKLKCTVKTDLWVRINDLKLFNTLFQSNATNPAEGFAISQKPLFINEYQ